MKVLSPRHIWQQFVRGTRYSWHGLKGITQQEFAFQIELMLFVIAIPLTFFLGKTSVHRVLMLSSVMLILLVECLNSAIEVVVDRISTENHPKSKLAKDAASAAVFIACVNALLVWLFVILG